jgi:biopolymer transport protein ExbD
MRIRRTTESSADLINVSSLIDVMFILIIFFMATTTFRQEERDIEVNLPETAENMTLSSAPKVLVINVRQDGAYLYADKLTTLDNLRDLLASDVEANPDHKVLIRGDHKALHGHVAAAVATCRQAGVYEANIGYQVGGTP